MEKVFEEQYGKGNAEFCRYAFGISSELLSKAEKERNSLESKRSKCYYNNNKNQHVRYCKDT